jgi:PAS domain S-box-containing protein
MNACCSSGGEQGSPNQTLPAGEAVRRSQESLAKSEAFYRSLVENLPQNILRKDLDGRFTYANQNFCRLVGRPLEEVLGKTDFDLYPADLAEKYRADDRAVMRSGKLLDQVEENPLPSGERRHVQVVKVPTYDAEGHPLGTQCIFWDITERKRAEAALRQSEEEHRALFEGALDAIFVADAETGILIDCNRAACALVGRDKSELVGQHQRILHPPTAIEGEFSRTFKQHLAEKTGQLLAEQVITKSGEIRDVEIKASLVEFQGRRMLLGIFRDVTERNRAEAALRESEAKFRSLAETSPAGILIHQGGRCRYVNAVLAAMTDYTREELLAMDFWELVHPDFRGLVKERGLARHRGEAVPSHCEFKVLTKGGGERWAELRATRCELEGQPAVMATAFDITERKRAEEQQLNLERQVQQAQKLESLGVLAGGIAHDFNNILTAIMGNITLALLELSPAAPAREELLEAEKATRRAADLAKQMLAYSGRGRFQVQRLDLQEVVEEMTHLLQASISKKAVLRFNFAANVPAIEADATQLRQVIMNLVINASEAIGERSGVIAISTGAMECDQAYLVETWLHEALPAGLYAYLEVADTGCGITKEQLPRIFDPFFTTKFTGRGLGLAAVLGIVRGHRGAIKVYTEVGKGSTFKVLFPATSQAAESLNDAVSAPTRWRGGGLLLLVDDEETVRAIGKKILERLGFEVLTAADGRQALEVFRAQADQIAGVVLDLTMPHMDGEETFRELRRIRAGVRVILSSGYSEQDAVQRFAGKGLAGFIQKPYTVDNLQAVLQPLFAGPKPTAPPSAG